MPHGPTGRVVRQGATAVPRPFFGSRMIEPGTVDDARSPQRCQVVRRHISAVERGAAALGDTDSRDVIVRLPRGPVGAHIADTMVTTVLDRSARAECHLDRAGCSEAQTPAVAAASVRRPSVRPDVASGHAPRSEGEPTDSEHQARGQAGSIPTSITGSPRWVVSASGSTHAGRRSAGASRSMRKVPMARTRTAGAARDARTRPATATPIPASALAYVASATIANAGPTGSSPMGTMPRAIEAPSPAVAAEIATQTAAVLAAGPSTRTRRRPADGRRASSLAGAPVQSWRVMVPFMPAS